MIDQPARKIEVLQASKFLMSRRLPANVVLYANRVPDSDIPSQTVVLYHLLDGDKGKYPQWFDGGYAFATSEEVNEEIFDKFIPEFSRVLGRDPSWKEIVFQLYLIYT